MLEEQRGGIKNEKILGVLQFIVQDVQLCMALHHIEKILPLPMLETVPHCPDYFVGVMNFHHQCVPVLDLAFCIDLPRDHLYSLNIPVLLCSDGHHLMGLIVDKVVGLDEINEQKIGMNEEITGNGSPFCGVISLKTGVSLLMNIHWISALKLTSTTNQSYTKL